MRHGLTGLCTALAVFLLAAPASAQSVCPPGPGGQMAPVATTHDLIGPDPNYYTAQRYFSYQWGVLGHAYSATATQFGHMDGAKIKHASIRVEWWTPGHSFGRVVRLYPNGYKEELIRFTGWFGNVARSGGGDLTAALQNVFDTSKTFGTTLSLEFWGGPMRVGTARLLVVHGCAEPVS